MISQKGWKGRKAKFLIIIVLLFFTGASYLLGWSAMFTVKHIAIVGAANSAEIQLIQEKSTIKIGEKMARLEPRVVSNLLGDIPWIDHSMVSRNWIDSSVQIRIWPRTPVAYFDGKYIDGAGVPFTLSNLTSIQLPIITASDIASAQIALLFLNELPELLKVKLLAIGIVSANSISLTLSEPSKLGKKSIFILWGDRNNMALKAKVYQALILLPENKLVTYVDVSAPHAPIVK